MFVHLLVQDIAKRSKGVKKAEPVKEAEDRPAPDAEKHGTTRP